MLPTIRPFARAAALLLGTLALGLSAAEPPFAHLESDLRADPAVRFGQLENGLRYAVLSNREPRERAALRLWVDVGSLHETDAQQGVAHFLEHMAFNGSRHYPPGTLIEFFQRMGMSFGADTNASTGFDRTIYMIDLPNTRPETVQEGLQVLHDYADGLLLTEEEINDERGVILSEKRTRDSVEYRSLVAEYRFLLDGTRLPRRFPIGEAEVIANAPRDQFVDFYHTWYRPDRMAIIAVGDFDAASVEQEIRQRFADLTPRAPNRPEPDLGAVAEATGLRVHYHHEPEAGSTSVSIETVVPHAFEPDTAANRVRDLPRSLALSIVNRRLAELAKQEGAPFSSGRASVYEGFDLFRNTSIALVTTPARWADALAVADQELRRALEHGFQAAELREAVAGFRNALEQAVRTASTRRSAGLASALLAAIADREVFTPPADDLALLGPALERVTVEDCLAAFRELWDVDHRYLQVIGNAELPADADAVIAARYIESHAQPVAPPAAITEAEFAYTDFGPAGEVVERRYLEDLEITQVRFANGVRLNLKRTDFEADRILMSVRVGTGQLTEPRDTPGLAVFASNTFTLGGLEAHSSDELRRILAGRNVGVSFAVGSDAFTFSGATTPEDLTLQLQLAAAYLTAPGYRPEAARLMEKSIEQFYTRLAHIPQGPLQLEVPRLLASGDPRFGLPPKAALDHRTLDEARTWLTPEFERGALEIGLAGDLDVDTAIAAVARTFGALPARDEKPTLVAARQVSFPAEPFARDYTVPTDIPKGIVALYWPTTDGRDARTARRLNVLANVLGDRLRVKVREEIGGAYSPGAGSVASDTYENYGYILANITVDPEKAPEIAAVTAELAADLAAQGVTDDELDRAKQPLLTSLRESARTNGYWLSAVLASAQEVPERLDWARNRYEDTASISKEEIDALARVYLGSDRAFQVIVLPAPR